MSQQGELTLAANHNETFALAADDPTSTQHDGTLSDPGGVTTEVTSGKQTGGVLGSCHTDPTVPDPSSVVRRTL